MSTETRTVRPFVGLDELQHALGGTALRFGEHCVPAGSSITVDLAPQEFLARPVSIEWAPDDQTFLHLREHIIGTVRSADLPIDAVALVVIATSSFLKLADLILECPLPQMAELPRITSLLGNGRRPRSLSTPFNGFTVHSYLLLRRALPDRLLRPHRMGTWLARTDYRVETTLGPGSLAPTPLTGEIRKQYDLPRKTVRFIHFGDHDPVQPYRDQEPPIFYVDEEILAQLNARRTAPTSRALQLQLAHDFVTAVVYRAAASPELEALSYDDVRTSLLGSVIRLAAGPGASQAELSALLAVTRRNPERLIARAEHFIDLADDYSAILKDGDS